jgi:hypothetical protein
MYESCVDNHRFTFCLVNWWKKIDRLTAITALLHFFRLLRLYRSHFKERQSFLLLLLLLFSYIRPLQLNDAFCFNNGVLVQESTSCFNHLARSIRRFVVTISQREYAYIHILLKKYERKIDHRQHPIIILLQIRLRIDQAYINYFLFLIQLCHQNCSHIWTSKFPVCQSVWSTV